MNDAVGTMRIARDAMDPARAEALAAVLGIAWKPGEALPPFAHQVYFWQALPEAALGRDGHPARGGLIPDLGLPRRMWAGGRLEFHAPLHAGRAAEKTTVLEGVTRKQGRTGPLGFVTLRHEVRQGGALCVTERQDLVYRADPVPGVAAPGAAAAPEGGEVVARRRFGPVGLFRYSALTLNGHRIHYDRDYAREVEGYGGLVVHGPLLAQHLMLVAAAAGPLARFSFRGHSAALGGEELRFCRKGARLWVAGEDGRLCLSGEAG